MSDILIEIENHVALVTLNRPAQMNALSASLRAALVEAFAALDRDDAVRVAILTGAGERAFCAGLDLKELGAGGASPNAIIEGDDDPVATLNRFRKPLIGAINGVAITGGFELALGCDVLLASANARFADTHGLVGILPGWGLSQKLSRIIGKPRAMALSLTGNFIDAPTAASWGLVNDVVAPDALLPAARRLAEDMTHMPAEMLVAYKSLITDGYGLSFADGMALEHHRSAAFNKTVTAADIEGRRAAIQARGRARTQP
jgi:enoyl-CoA hydratase